MHNSDPLAEEELKEANAYLLLFQKAHATYTVAFGGLLISAPALLLLLFFYWVFELGAVSRGALGGSVVLLLMFVIGSGGYLRRKRFFEEIKNRCLKLQRSGYTVYKHPVFLINILGATRDFEKKNIQVINFETLDPQSLHDNMV